MVRWAWFPAAIATLVGAGEVAAAERSVGVHDGGFLLLALLALIPLRMAMKIIPEWIKSFHEREESKPSLVESEGP